MKLKLDISDYGMSVGNAIDNNYIDTTTQETVLFEGPINRRGFGLGDYDGDKTAYADAIEAYLISIGIADAEAKSIAKLAKDLAKDIVIEAQL